MITPNDIYNSKVNECTTDIDWLIEYLFPNESADDFDIQKISIVIIKNHVNQVIDNYGERGISIDSIWFKGNPVMIILKAGRGLMDEDKESINDSKLYKDMKNFILSLKIEDSIIEKPFNEPNSNISKIYGFSTRELLNLNE